MQDNIQSASPVRGAIGFGRKRGVLLREPEKCAECNRIFVSLYSLRECSDHEGLDEI